jgi:dienelactone hydrolase
MTIQTRLVEYHDGEVLLEGFLAFDDAVGGPRPGVAVAHAWRGREEFECDKARALAGLGYTGFALDLYGKGVRGGTVEQNVKLMQPFLDDRGMLQRRMTKAIEVMRSLTEVRPDRIAAIGFCFGGLCVLDLARTGIDIAGVVSFHGLFNPPDNIKGRKIKTRVLALHGHDDPMVPVEQVVALEKELTAARADWQVHVYGHTVHAFSNPDANDPKLGTIYNEAADRRSWQTMQNFLAEVLA